MDDKAMAAYRELLVEIKYRIETIDAVLAGNFSLRGKIAEELCYLQLRMICEVIAVGCLIINSEISSKKRIYSKTIKLTGFLGRWRSFTRNFIPTHWRKMTNPPIMDCWSGSTKQRDSLQKRIYPHFGRGVVVNCIEDRQKVF